MSKNISNPDTGLSYADAGVDIDAGNALVDAIKPLVKATRRPGADGSIGGFGGVFDLKATGYRDPLLVAANDGVGTKLKIAIETGLHDSIGIDLVAMCVNDLIVQGAEPLFFLDYYATGKLDISTAKAVIASIAKGCEMAGCALSGGETAEMPGMYSEGDYDLAGFCVGAVERGDLLPAKVGEGDVILGLASNGVHSNGYSLVRRVVERMQLSFNGPAPFGDRSLGEELLEPTRIYVKSVLTALRADRSAIKAIAHITGGGLTENLPRVLPASIDAEINLNYITPPPVFGWLKRDGGIENDEMLRTFNCGIGLTLVVAADKVEAVTSLLEAEGESVSRIGQLVRGTGKVVYSGEIDWAAT